MASKTYLADKIRQALARSGGNAPAAQKLLVAWAVEDGHLMQALALPYLPGLVAKAMSDASPAKPKAKTTAKPQRRPVTAEDIDRLADRMGKRFDQTAGTGDQPSRQAASLRALAVGHARRRYDPDRPTD